MWGKGSSYFYYIHLYLYLPQLIIIYRFFGWSSMPPRIPLDTLYPFYSPLQPSVLVHEVVCTSSFYHIPYNKYHEIIVTIDRYRKERITYTHRVKRTQPMKFLSLTYTFYFFLLYTGNFHRYRVFSRKRLRVTWDWPASTY